MPESPTDSTQIPVEIVSEEEMALIDAAFAAARSFLPSSTSSSAHLARNSWSTRSVNLSVHAKNRVAVVRSEDIEDSLGIGTSGSAIAGIQKKDGVAESFLNRFRRRRGLSVTDITATEWCEKQMEFFLLFGKPEKTEAMKAGSARHAVLEEEVIQRIDVQIESVEDIWALKFMNFMVGVNQLIFDGLTRELPVVGFVEGVWMVGIIDEIRMPVTDNHRFPTLVDTKTRIRATLPSEAQCRNGRLQLMCYKHLWDNLAGDKFPYEQFFDFFSLQGDNMLSPEIRVHAANSGFLAETLNDLVSYFRNTCCMIHSANDQLLLRYELQEDQSMIGEDQFLYDAKWLKGQIEHSLEFWLGKREARCVSKDESWKCRFCKFASECPVGSNRDS